VHAFGVRLEEIATSDPLTFEVNNPSVESAALAEVQSALPVGTIFNLFPVTLFHAKVVPPNVPVQTQSAPNSTILVFTDLTNRSPMLA